MLTSQTINRLAIIAAYGLIGAVGLSIVLLGVIAVTHDGAATQKVLDIAGNMAALFGAFLGGMGLTSAAGIFFGRQSSPAGQAAGAAAAVAVAANGATGAAAVMSNNPPAAAAALPAVPALPPVPPAAPAMPLAPFPVPASATPPAGS